MNRNGNSILSENILFQVLWYSKVRSLDSMKTHRSSFRMESPFPNRIPVLRVYS